MRKAELPESLALHGLRKAFCCHLADARVEAADIAAVSSTRLRVVLVAASPPPRRNPFLLFGGVAISTSRDPFERGRRRPAPTKPQSRRLGR